MKLYLVSIFACSVGIQPGTTDQVDMHSAHWVSLHKGYSEEDVVRQVLIQARAAHPLWQDDWHMSINVKEVDQIALRTHLKSLEQ